MIDPTVVDMHPYPVEPERITPGTEATANVLWDREGGNELGAVWQMTPGVLEGVKAEETFIVISGRATIEFEDGRVSEIGPGSVGVFFEKDSTRWTVHETLRKIIVRPAR
ncbi:cupin domain-containing protein [Gordonia sp. SID5947]|uniref:cupin domain-containing protein n=1 Tax=Gordonia sp. SID5947 TaxID=2690315 RepID=UPI001928ACEA